MSEPHDPYETPASALRQKVVVKSWEEAIKNEGRNEKVAYASWCISAASLTIAIMGMASDNVIPKDKLPSQEQQMIAEIGDNVVIPAFAMAALSMAIGLYRILKDTGPER